MRIRSETEWQLLAAHARECLALCDHTPTEDEIAKAAALLAIEPGARQPELELELK